jgi:serine/threonine protein kinase
MLKIDGYEILTQIYDSTNSNVYRGIRQEDNQPVILKILKEDYPTPSELTRYKQEYEITRNLNLDGVIKAYELKPYQMTLCTHGVTMELGYRQDILLSLQPPLIKSTFIGINLLKLFSPLFHFYPSSSPVFPI